METVRERVLGGRYVLGGLLGRGGMAEVYLARDLRLDRQVAVKVMRPGMAVDPLYLERFRREGRSAASLSHPAVVAVFDSGEDTAGGEPLPYLVMEHVQGLTLLELMRGYQGERGTSVRRALELVDGVLSGLAYAHAQGIVHRDIKPANVMLAEDGQVKVMDFGIARPMAQPQELALTQTSIVVGTAEYLSPEQARGTTVDARADLYSAGCLLFELLTGRPPFVGDTPVAVVWQHLQSEPQPPSQLAPAVPPSCDALVLRALAKDREQRFGSAGEMRTAVRGVLESLAVPVRADATVQLTAGGSGDGRRRRGSGARRVRTVLVVGAAVVAACGAYALVGAARHVRTPDLQGVTLAAARPLLHRDGLWVAHVIVGGCPGQAAAVRRICGQSPAAGTTVRFGTGVTVRIGGLAAPG